MNWRKTRKLSRKRLWQSGLRKGEVLLGALALLAGCAREVQVVSRSGSGASGQLKSAVPIPASVPGVDPSQDPVAALPVGSTNESSALSGTYTLSYYRCMTSSGPGSPQYVDGGSLGSQSETLTLSPSHFHDVISYSLGCTLFLDYDIVYASGSELKMNHRQFSLLYLGAPDTSNKCADAAPSAASPSDNFNFSYTFAGPTLAFNVQDSATATYCGSNVMQSVYVKN